MFDFTRPFHFIRENAVEEEKKRVERVNTALKEFIDYYMPNKIFFNKSLSEKIDDIRNEYYLQGWDFANIHNALNEKKLLEEIYKEYANKKKVISENIKNNFPPLIQELEKEFREILGVK